MIFYKIFYSFELIIQLFIFLNVTFLYNYLQLIKSKSSKEIV